MGASLIPKPPSADRGWLNLRKMEAGGQPCWLHAGYLWSWESYAILPLATGL